MSDLVPVRKCAAHGNEPAIHVQQYLRPNALPQTIIRCDHGCQIIGHDEAAARRIWNFRRAESQVGIHDHMFRDAPRDDREAIVPLKRVLVVDDKTLEGCKNKHDNEAAFARSKRIPTSAFAGGTYETRLIRGEIYDAACKERDQAIRDRVAMEDERDTARLDAKAALDALKVLQQSLDVGIAGEHRIQDKLRIERDNARAEVEEQNKALTEMRLRLAETEQQRLRDGGAIRALEENTQYLRGEIDKYRDSEVRFEAMVIESVAKRVAAERVKLIEMKSDRDVARATAALEKKRLAAAREAMVNLRGLESDQLPDILESFDQAVASI